MTILINRKYIHNLRQELCNQPILRAQYNQDRPWETSLLQSWLPQWSVGQFFQLLHWCNRRKIWISTNKTIRVSPRWTYKTPKLYSMWQSFIIILCMCIFLLYCLHKFQSKHDPGTSTICFWISHTSTGFQSMYKNCGTSRRIKNNHHRRATTCY